VSGAGSTDVAFVNVFADASVAVDIIEPDMTGTSETAVGVGAVCINGTIVSFSVALVDILAAKSVAIKAVFTSTGEATVLSVNVGADSVGMAVIRGYLSGTFDISAASSFRLDVIETFVDVDAFPSVATVACTTFTSVASDGISTASKVVTLVEFFSAFVNVCTLSSSPISVAFVTAIAGAQVAAKGVLTCGLVMAGVKLSGALVDVDTIPHKAATSDRDIVGEANWTGAFISTEQVVAVGHDATVVGLVSSALVVVVADESVVIHES
jgi:hypothetical protein